MAEFNEYMHSFHNSYHDEENAQTVYSDSDDAKPARIPYTRTMVSKVAYLTGVPEKFFSETSENKLDDAVYAEMDKDKNARVIRHLCILRTAFLDHNDIIFNSICREMKGIEQIDCLPAESIRQLRADGIEMVKANQKPNAYVVDINRYIQERIGNCEKFFPEWLKFAYIKDMIVMPNGRNEKKILQASRKYYQNRQSYPFQVYLNLRRNPDANRNLYVHDRYFLQEIYSQNSDSFNDLRKVMDVSYATKKSIYDFIGESETTTIVVDCENSDPYKLYATMQSLGQKHLINRVNKIILYDDVHTGLAWSILDSGINIPIQHEEVDRVKNAKSLVDMTLALGVSKEFYEHGTSSFILYSSDSDYYGLIRSLPKVGFLVMIEEAKCSRALKAALEEKDILYCSIDDFCGSGITSLKYRTILKALRRDLEQELRLNIEDMLEKALLEARTFFTTDERNTFRKSYIEKMKLSIKDNGSLCIEI